MSLAANTVVIQFDGKTFIGLTSHNFSISPEVRTSITRDGVTKEKVRFPYSGSIEAVAEIKDVAETTKIDRNDAIAMVLSTAPVEIIYTPGTGSDSYEGQIIITGFDEKAGADDTVTYTLNFEDDGTILTKVV
jgi:hypothetical protein